MGTKRGYRLVPMSGARLAMAAGQEVVRRRHLMYAIVEADLTAPLAEFDRFAEREGLRPSVAGFVATCLARALAEHPELNALRRGRKLVVLDEIIVVVLIERQVGGQPAVSYLPIHDADTKSLAQVTREIREEQVANRVPVPGQRLLERVPVLAPLVFRAAGRSIRWALRYGVAGVNNVGFAGGVTGWGVSPGAGTIAVTVGGITSRPGPPQRRIAHLTLTFDHDVVDGAPAARFTTRLVGLLKSGEALTQYGDGS